MRKPPASQGPSVEVSRFPRRGGTDIGDSEHGGRYVLYFHVVPALESSTRTPSASSSFRIRSASAKSFRARASLRSSIRRSIFSAEGLPRLNSVSAPPLRVIVGPLETCSSSLSSPPKHSSA